MGDRMTLRAASDQQMMRLNTSSGTALGRNWPRTSRREKMV
jgi:hypothetical protein